MNMNRYALEPTATKTAAAASGTTGTPRRPDRAQKPAAEAWLPISLPGGWRGERLAATPTGEPFSLPGLAEWKAFLSCLLEGGHDLPKYEVLKYSRSGEVIRTAVPAQPGPFPVVCKRTEPERIWSRWCPNRGRRVGRRYRRWAGVLAELGIRVPRLLLYVSRGGVCWLVTEYNPDLTDLDTLAHTQLPRLTPHALWRAKQVWQAAVLDLCIRLDARGLYHRDFKASNVLLAGWNSTKTKAEPCLVDLDGILPVRWWQPGRRWHPLVRLAASLQEHPAVTRSDTVRFLQRYLAATGQSPEAWRKHYRRLARRIEGYRQRALRRKRRKLEGFEAV